MKKFLIAIALAGASTPALAQDATTLAILEEQREKMAVMAWTEGLWRGEATYMGPSGPIKLIQTERVGPFLGGTVKLVEGRGYNPDTGQSVFNALGILEWNVEEQAYKFNTFAQGRGGQWPVEMHENGYDWWIDTGPATLRYETRFDGNVWTEIGYREMGEERIKFFEMNLVRMADSDWPDAVPMDIGQGD